MTEDLQNSEALAKPKPQEDGTAAIEKSHVPVSRDPSRLALNREEKGTLKKIAWRTTAAFYWLWWLTRVSFGSQTTSGLRASLTGRFVDLLSSVGFRPVHHESLGNVLKIGWLVTIAGFRPLELLGLAIYIVISPLTLLVYLVFREVVKEASSSRPEKRGLRPPRSQRLALRTVSMLLLGWYLLYGETTSRGPLIVGAVLSGVLFFLLLSLAFQRVKPVSVAASSPAWLVDRVGLAFLQSIPESLKKVENSKKRQDAVAQAFICKRARRFYRFLALLIRGQGGKNKLYLLLLLEYVFSLMVLALTAILFWAITTKAAVAPSALSVSTFMWASAAYFLPFLGAYPVSFTIPLWARFGQAITAVLLFVLYVGASASLLPNRQSAYAERLGVKYRIYRKFVLGFKSYLLAFEKVKTTLPR